MSRLQLLITGFLLLFTLLFGVLPYYNATKYAAQVETHIQTQYKQMENVLSTFRLKVEEVVQVPDMYKEDFVEIVEASMSGRYGENGSNAMFQWLKESYPGNLDAEMYVAIQDIIASGRNEFKNEQKLFLDIKRGYEETLVYDLFLTRGFWLKVSGYPKIDLSDFEIISDNRTQSVFDHKVQDSLKLK